MRPEHARAFATAEIDLKRRNRATKYARAVLDTARRFLAMVPRRALAKLTRLDVERYLASRVQAADLSASTVAHEQSMLQVFFAILVNHDLLTETPTDGMTPPKRTTPPQVLLSEKGVRGLLAAALDRPRPERNGGPTLALALRDRALLELLYATGVRDSEARAARVIDLDIEGATLLVRAAKRGEWRRAPLPPRALAAVLSYLREARPLLVRDRPDPGHLIVTRRASPLSQSTSFGIVRAAARRAGVRAHPHALRRAVATHLVRARVAIPAVQALLGHKRLATTAAYVTVDREDLRRTVALLEPGGTRT